MCLIVVPFCLLQGMLVAYSFSCPNAEGTVDLCSEKDAVVCDND